MYYDDGGRGPRPMPERPAVPAYSPMPQRPPWAMGSTGYATGSGNMSYADYYSGRSPGGGVGRGGNGFRDRLHSRRLGGNMSGLGYTPITPGQWQQQIPYGGGLPYQNRTFLRRQGAAPPDMQDDQMQGLGYGQAPLPPYMQMKLY